jgi:hypothetical protein
MASVSYCTREQVKAALDVKETARSNAQIDRAIFAGARAIEGQLRRKFYPWSGTKYFDWPNDQRAQVGRLWLDANEVISVSALTSGGTSVAGTDYFLEPVNAGPPYTYIDIDRASNAEWASLPDTPQRSIAITGIFGYTAEEESIGALAGALGALSTDTAPVTLTTAKFGVGDIIRIDSERMIITERTMSDTGQNLGNSPTASAASVTITVTSGTAFAIGEIILIDSERMLVVDIAGTNLVVKRAWDGSVLAAHTAGADIYGMTGMELARGQLGTTTAAHLDDAEIYRHVVPPLIVDLNIAEAISQLQQEGAGYGRLGVQRVGKTDRYGKEELGNALAMLRAQALQAYGRIARVRSI